jgi:hypothetical protein
MSRQHLIRVLALGVILSLPAGVMVSAPPAIASHETYVATVAAPIVAADIKPAADLSQFRPGNIISDATFSDSATMSASEIQSFLESKVPRCQSGYTCLKDWTDTSRTVAADAMCGAYSGVANERSSQIVYKVAQACGINPRVLLVMLQKEQGLVTHTWPSDWRYTIAMGQGCPDTAACDTRYYGFFNQVYGAAWQLKRYSNPPGTSAYFTWYAPGKTWNVRYNPDAACGSSPVHVENQATANLYYYTPYQPNAAALRAGYGEGDACSAYGNRNFYNYFTDWFGSLQSADVALARTADDPAVYLLSGSSRWHVTDGDDYAELNAALGPTRTVSSATLSAYAPAGVTGAVLRNPTDGMMALVQEGRYHRLPSCDVVAALGASCASPTNVGGSIFARMSRGDDVGSFFRVRGTTLWGRFDGGINVTPLYNDAAVRAVTKDMTRTPYAPFVSAARYSSFVKAPLMFAPAQLVKSASDSRVFLTLDFDRLAWVPAWSAVREYNRFPADLAVVDPADLSRYREDGDVAQTLTCSATTYFPAAGWLHRLEDPNRSGLETMTAEADTCLQFSAAAGSINGDLAIMSTSSPSVFVIERGEARAVLTWSLLVQHNGGVAPPILTVASQTLESLPMGVPIADGIVVKSASSPDLKFISGEIASWIPSAGIAADVGIALRYRELSDSQVQRFQKGGDVGLWIACGDMTFFAASGRLWPTTPTAARGFTPLALSSAACATLVREARAIDVVAVKTGGSPVVYVAENGVLRPVSTWSALVRVGGGVAPPVLTISAAGLASFSIGDPVQ